MDDREREKKDEKAREEKYSGLQDLQGFCYYMAIRFPVEGAEHLLQKNEGNSLTM